MNIALVVIERDLNIVISSIPFNLPQANLPKCVKHLLDTCSPNLMTTVKASHLKLVTILLPFNKAVSSSTFYYGFYTRYCNRIRY